MERVPMPTSHQLRPVTMAMPVRPGIPVQADHANQAHLWSVQWALAILHQDPALGSETELLVHPTASVLVAVATRAVVGIAIMDINVW
jgi:hypothetical protein